MQAEAAFRKPINKPPKPHQFQEAKIYTEIGDRVYLPQIIVRIVSKFRLKAAVWVCLFGFVFSLLS